MAAVNLPPAGSVVPVPPVAALAATTPWPAILVGVVVVVGACLWLLFRSGSIADRARTEDDEAAASDADDRAPGSGADGGDQSPTGGR